MYTIDMRTLKNVSLRMYPDNQPHVQISIPQADDDVQVIAPIRSALELVQLAMVSNALDNIGARKVFLVIPYLMGARYDRYMEDGGSIDLEVVADIVNSMMFKNVVLFDVHSEAALNAVLGSTNRMPGELLGRYNKFKYDDVLIICPDKGAERKLGFYQACVPTATEYIQCAKKRDLKTGKIDLIVDDPGYCNGRHCVIIDDICDGGGTFLAIADQIRKVAKPVTLTLIVTHGIFSKGFSELEKQFDHIITSDSFRIHSECRKLIQVETSW